MNKKFLYIALSTMTLLITLHLKSQQMGNEHIWPVPSGHPIAYDSSPCISLKERLAQQNGREPALDALIQFCIAKANLNHQALHNAIDAAIPNAIAIEVKRIADATPAQTAISLRPELEKETNQHCENLFRSRPRICNPATRQQTDSDVDQALANLIASSDERLSETALKWSLTLGDRAAKIAALLPKDTLKNKAADFLLNSRALQGKAKRDHIDTRLTADDPLNALATLEAIELNSNKLNKKIEGLIVNSPNSLAASLGRKHHIKTSN